MTSAAHATAPAGWSLSPVTGHAKLDSMRNKRQAPRSRGFWDIVSSTTLWGLLFLLAALLILSGCDKAEPDQNAAVQVCVSQQTGERVDDSNCPDGRDYDHLLWYPYYYPYGMFVPPYGGLISLYGGGTYTRPAVPIVRAPAGGGKNTYTAKAPAKVAPVKAPAKPAPVKPATAPKPVYRGR